MSLEGELLRNAIEALVDEYRGQCLWFLRPDSYPTSFEQRLRVLSYIERYGISADTGRALAFTSACG